jgi:predicted dehydrogenase
MEHRVAFVGAGAVAHYHAHALAVLPFYYPRVPSIRLVAVASANPASSNAFSSRFGFASSSPAGEIWPRGDIDTIFLLGPNALHFTHLERALAMPSVKRIYVEKPLCASEEEERAIEKGLIPLAGERVVQVGFQFLQMPAARRARMLYRGGEFGRPVHFRASYLHSGYLDREYRRKRPERLKPAPVGGAAADLGSHALSLLVAFLGDSLEVADARQCAPFEDVPSSSDLCSIALLTDRATGAVGTLTASRISAGAGESLEVEIRCVDGGFRFSTERPDELEVFEATAGSHQVVHCGSDYGSQSHFPQAVVSPGWLRSFIHAQYIFLGGRDDLPAPDLHHGLSVQRLLRESVNRFTRHLASS